MAKTDNFSSEPAPMSVNTSPSAADLEPEQAPPAVPVEQSGEGPGTGVGTSSFDPEQHDVAYQSAGGPEETYHAEIVSAEGAREYNERTLEELAERVGSEAEAPSVDDASSRNAEARTINDQSIADLGEAKSAETRDETRGS